MTSSFSGYMAHRYGRRTIAKWSEQNLDANIGLCAGLNGLTVVDDDNPSRISEFIARFGGTPLVTQTPSGGYHLWNRSSGERSQDLRPHLEGEIKCWKVQIILAPSAHFETQCRWLFIAGDETGLNPQKLPPVNPRSIPETRPSQRQTLKPAYEMSEGDGRNYRLLDHLLGKASHIHSEESLIEEACSFNRQFAEFMSDDEVLRVVGSVMKYKQENRLFRPGCEPHSLVRKSERLALQDDPDTLALLLVLRENHSARCQRGETFAVSPTGMATAAKLPHSELPNWGHKRFAKARNHLLDCRMISLVRRRRGKTPDQYTFTK
jgi:hypothetical protein